MLAAHLFSDSVHHGCLLTCLVDGAAVSLDSVRNTRIAKVHCGPRSAEHRDASTAVRRTTRPEPTRAEIAEHTGMDDLDAGAGQLGDDDPWNGRRVPKAESDRVYNEDGTELRGAAAAAHAAKTAGA